MTCGKDKVRHCSQWPRPAQGNPELGRGMMAMSGDNSISSAIYYVIAVQRFAQKDGCPDFWPSLTLYSVWLAILLNLCSFIIQRAISPKSFSSSEKIWAVLGLIKGFISEMGRLYLIGSFLNS